MDRYNRLPLYIQIYMSEEFYYIDIYINSPSPKVKCKYIGDLQGIVCKITKSLLIWSKICKYFLNILLSHPNRTHLLNISFYLSIPLYICLYIYLSHSYQSTYLSDSYLSVYLSISFISVSLFIYLSHSYLSIYLSIRLVSVHLTIYPSFQPYIYLSFYLYINISVYLSVFLSICLFIYL